MIFPRVKEMTEGQGALTLPFPLTLSAGAQTDRALKLLGLFLPGVPVGRGDAVVALDGDCPPEGYSLSVSDRVIIRHADAAGLRNALSTLSLIAKQTDGALVLPRCEINDSPAAPHRGLMLDPARGVIPPDELQDRLVFAAKCKFNVLHLHIADSHGFSVKLRCLPDGMMLENAYGEAEVARINELCGLLGLEIIPEFDLPAHSRQLTKVFPEFRCDGDGSGWVACTADERLFGLYERVIDELCALFPNGRYFHMGGDELEFADHPELNALCGWDGCKRCLEMRKRLGLADKREQYYYVVRRVNEAVKRRGRRLMMWSDQLDCTRPDGMPKDILMHFWRVAAKGRGPVDGCSMDAQLKLGYDVVNSFYRFTYPDLHKYATPERLSAWRWDREPETSPENAARVLGSELCAWGPHDHYPYSLPPVLVAFGDKLWSGGDTDYAAHGVEIARAVLGAKTPDGFDPYAAIGDLFTPREEGLSYPEKVALSATELQKTLETLKDGTLFSGGDARRAAALIPCVENTLNAKTE